MSRPEYAKAIRNLGKWSDREPWLERLSQIVTLHLGPIEEEYGMDADDIDELLGEHRAQMLRRYILEDFCAVEFGAEEKQNVVDAYLEKHGWRENVPGKRYLEAIRQSVVSLYEVVGVGPDGAVTLRDRFRDDDPVVLAKERALEDLGQGSYIAGRIVVINGDPWLADGHLSISPEIVTDILEAFGEWLDESKRIRPGPAGPGDDAEAVERVSVLSPPGLAAMMSWSWMWHALDQALSSEDGKFEDMDEEDFEYFEVHFPLREKPEAIASVLDTAEEFERIEDEDGDEGFLWVWIGPATPGNGGFRQWLSRLLGKNANVGDGYLGMVEISEGEVILDTHSEEFAKRGRDLLASCLGDRIGSPRETSLDLEDDLEGGPGLTPARSAPLPPLTDQARHARLTDHYRQTLDEPVSVLDGKTPREAVQTEDGCQKVSDWLELLEEFESRYAIVHGFEPFDLTWMREELGVDGARRH